MTTRKTYKIDRSPLPKNPPLKSLEKLMAELLDDVEKIVKAEESNTLKEFFEPPPGRLPGVDGDE